MCATSQPDRIWRILATAGSKVDVEDNCGRTPSYYLTHRTDIHLPDKVWNRNEGGQPSRINIPVPLGLGKRSTLLLQNLQRICLTYESGFTSKILIDCNRLSGKVRVKNWKRRPAMNRWWKDFSTVFHILWYKFLLASAVYAFVFIVFVFQ